MKEEEIKQHESVINQSKELISMVESSQGRPSEHTGSKSEHKLVQESTMKFEDQSSFENTNAGNVQY